MGNRNKPKNNNVNNSNGKNYSIGNKIWWIVQNVIVGLIGALTMYGVFTIPEKIGELSAKVEDLKDQNQKLDTSLKERISIVEEENRDLNSKYNQLYSDLLLVNASIENMNDKCEAIYNLAEKLIISNNSSIVIYQTSSDGTTVGLTEPSWGEEGKNPEFIAITRCFAHTRMIYNYEQDNSQFYFAGQYDENGQWDGECLINVYSGGLLQMAVKNEYISGEVVSSKQLFKTSNGIWMYAERQYYKEEDMGDSWKYNGETLIAQKVAMDNPIEKDLVDPEFEKNQLGEYIQHYHGGILDGLYNDNTGSSYMVSKYSDGTIKTIYWGGFKDGTFFDESYDAWYVSRIKERNTRYNYYVGPFRNGGPALNGFAEGVYFDDAISKEELEYIIKDTPFENESGWIESLFDDKNDMDCVEYP